MKIPHIKWSLIALAGAALLLSGCADAVSFPAAAARAPVGFGHGLWHGMILPVAWVISLFDPDVAIYNNHGMYDFGFVLGCGAICIGFKSAK
jgi:hypothetical protein